MAYTCYLSNAFSLGMVPRELLSRLRFDPVDQKYWDDLREWGARSIVGHADTAALLGVPANRESVALQWNDILIVAQYIGPRLPEGATVLPEGARFEFIKVSFA